MNKHARSLQVISTMAAWVLGTTVTSLVSVSSAAASSTEPFKVTNIHFETNASACDMGIQLIFDTEGIVDGFVRSPEGRKIYEFASRSGMKLIGGQTEGFLEGVEPQITELLAALGCEASDEEEEIPIDELFDAFPAGTYTFNGRGTEGGIKFQDQAVLSHAIPAGAVITAPADGTVVLDTAPLFIDWEPVTGPVLPELGPVDIVGYHVVVVEGGGEALPQYDVDVPETETSVSVPAEYLKPGTYYDFEVLATEASGNQTISEGFFCTQPVVECEEP